MQKGVEGFWDSGVCKMAGAASETPAPALAMAFF